MKKVLAELGLPVPERGKGLTKRNKSCDGSLGVPP